mgnify:CR=1 FL=1
MYYFSSFFIINLFFNFLRKVYKQITQMLSLDYIIHSIEEFLKIFPHLCMVLYITIIPTLDLNSPIRFILLHIHYIDNAGSKRPNKKGIHGEYYVDSNLQSKITCTTKKK